MKSPTGPGHKTSGSPSTGEPEYLVVGSLGRPHGLRGDLLMSIITDFPERLVPGTRVFLGERHMPATIATTRSHGHGLLIKFQGIDTREDAGVHRNQRVYVSAAGRPALPRGQWYHHQLVGSAVVDESDGEVGKLDSIISTGANDVYVVDTPSGAEILLPAIEGVILQVDPRKKLIRVRIPDGINGADIE